MFRLPHINIQTPRTLVQDYPYELCGFLFKADVNYQFDLFIESVGEFEYSEHGVRGKCVSDPNHPMKWHTHSNTMPFYFSGADIVTTIQTSKKENYIHGVKSEFIFTSEGIWEILALHTFDLQKDWIKFLIKNIDFFGDEYRENRITLEQLIDYTMQEVNNRLGNRDGIRDVLKIFFTRWREIDTNTNIYKFKFLNHLEALTRGYTVQNRYDLQEVYYTNIPRIKNKYRNSNIPFT